MLTISFEDAHQHSFNGLSNRLKATYDAIVAGRVPPPSMADIETLLQVLQSKVSRPILDWDWHVKLPWPEREDVARFTLPDPEDFQPTAAFRALKQEIVSRLLWLENQLSGLTQEARDKALARLERERDEAAKTLYQAILTDLPFELRADYKRQCIQAREDQRQAALAAEQRYSEAIVAWEKQVNAMNNAFSSAKENSVVEAHRQRFSILLNPRVPVEHVPWRLLPPGETGAQALIDYFRRVSVEKPTQKIDFGRLDFALSLNPEKVIVGLEGADFDGYVAFTFTYSPKVLIDNAVGGNAAYIFGSDWQSLARLSKSELLSHPAAFTRVIHTISGTWKQRILHGIIYPSQAEFGF